MTLLIGFDADGVLLDSMQPALRIAGGILDLMGMQVEMTGQGDFERHFGAEALKQLVGPHRAGALRMTHRLAMLKAAASMLVFHETLAVVDRQPLPCILITAAFAEGVRTALGPHARLFQSITGFETGRKDELLAAVANQTLCYVTDSVSDLRICQRLEIPTIAVTGGFDSHNDLAAAGADVIASKADELEAALAVYHPTQPKTTKEKQNV